MITVSVLGLLCLTAACVVAGWVYGMSYERDHPRKGTQELYGDHLKVHAVRKLLRMTNYNGFADCIVEPYKKKATLLPSQIINQIRHEIGDAEYREF